MGSSSPNSVLLTHHEFEGGRVLDVYRLLFITHVYVLAFGPLWNTVAHFVTIISDISPLYSLPELQHETIFAMSA